MSLSLPTQWPVTSAYPRKPPFAMSFPTKQLRPSNPTASSPSSTERTRSSWSETMPSSAPLSSHERLRQLVSELPCSVGWLTSDTCRPHSSSVSTGCTQLSPSSPRLSSIKASSPTQRAWLTDGDFRNTPSSLGLTGTPRSLLLTSEDLGMKHQDYREPIRTLLRSTRWSTPSASCG